MIESGLEGLVLDEQTLIGREGGVGGAQAFLEPALVLPHVGRAGVVGTVGEPGRDIAAAGGFGHFDGVENVIQSFGADGRVGVRERAVFIFLILKDVGAHGADADTQVEGALRGRGGVRHTAGEVPEHVHGDGGAAAGEAVHLGGVGQFFVDGGGGGGVEELAEARAGVGEGPGGEFDPERV